MIDLNWDQIADIINKEFREDETQYRSEAAYRKRYAEAKKFYESCFSKMEPKEHQEELQKLNREIARNSIMYRDERRSWNKQNYEDARFEEVMKLLEERFDNFAKVNFTSHDVPKIDGNKSMIISLSDLHIGQTFSSFFGEYNSDIAKERLDKYLGEVIRIARTNNVSNAYVVLLGDGISNSLHKTIEVSNKENVIDQLKLSIEYITSFCYELTYHFKNVFLASVSGNHTRLQAKDLAQHSERLDAFIAWDVCRVLEDKQQNFHSLLHRSIDDGIADINVNGKTYLLVHGDYDKTTRSGFNTLSSLVGFFPDYILCGHRHFCSYSQDSRFIQSGSLAGGGDDYTIERRLDGKASQMVCVCNDNGIESLHPVILS